MKKEDIKELYYITHIDNLVSVLKNGILCHEKSKKTQHKSVANTEVQERRAKVVIPGGKKLHCYANLYFNARNPMMRAIVDNEKHKELAVVQVDSSVLDVDGVIISDHNASADYVCFYSVKSGLAKLKNDQIFARYWTDTNPFVQFEKKSAICAEVLIPNCVPKNFIAGVYVSCDESLRKAKSLLTDSLCTDKIFINSDLFFQ
ncbi:MAG: hypothetical protein AUJ85_00315 [Elusimicrobia bacterium CG1_02_37_114]|nr:MAG: hypothetical protein AUJ85_00315 [Elusimicrobia bacterium CG1_02_37_114]PIV53143.1 MAG: DUF4433 domain-containing protein [Elusimicrobia bacterium CG02_land_8_20_14_3_00_37_13]PIZ13890.1 MAG: DUF4433 domain-containing protein [Elusimicrobia bacterium CG_4_10_14_0_8_um_filter_37_32]